MEQVRISFSYPTAMKKELEKMANVYGIKLMGYIKLIIRKEAKKLKEKI